MVQRSRLIGTLTGVAAVVAFSICGFVASVSASAAWLVKPPTVIPTVPARAMWLWNWTDNATVIAFAKTHQVTEIFAYVAPGFTNPAMVPPQWSQPEWPLIIDLATQAQTAQIRLVAMGGDPSWVLQPAVAGAWAAEVRSSGLFAGAHLELEPWQLPAWTTDRATTIGQTVAAAAAVRAKLGGLPLELSLPWWLYQYNTADGTTFDRALLAQADSAAIVTFFNTTRQVVSSGAREQADAAALGKPARLAVETNKVQPAWITFAGTSQPAFTQALNAIDTANAGRTGYLGVAVEDYTGWAALAA